MTKRGSREKNTKIGLFAILLFLSLTSCDKWAGMNITKKPQLAINVDDKLKSKRGGL